MIFTPSTNYKNIIVFLYHSNLKKHFYSLKYVRCQTIGPRILLLLGLFLIFNCYSRERRNHKRPHIGLEPLPANWKENQSDDVFTHVGYYTHSNYYIIIIEQFLLGQFKGIWYIIYMYNGLYSSFILFLLFFVEFYIIRAFSTIPILN
jgi:hypothetical protein